MESWRIVLIVLVVSLNIVMWYFIIKLWRIPLNPPREEIL